MLGQNIYTSPYKIVTKTSNYIIILIIQYIFRQSFFGCLYTFMSPPEVT